MSVLVDKDAVKPSKQVTLQDDPDSVLAHDMDIFASMCSIGGNPSQALGMHDAFPIHSPRMHVIVGFETVYLSSQTMSHEDLDVVFEQFKEDAVKFKNKIPFGELGHGSSSHVGRGSVHTPA